MTTNLELRDVRKSYGGLVAVDGISLAVPVEAIPEHDTSSRHLRNRRYWREEEAIQPGKLVGWILSSEDGGWRIKR
jgi:hypothetical protein